MRTEPETTRDGAFRAVTPSGRRRRRIVLFVLTGLVALAAVMTIVDALRVAGRMREGRATFAAIAREGFAAEGRLHEEARAGAGRFATADRIARRSIWLSGLARAPVLGRPARWLRAAAATTATLSSRAADAAGRIEPRLAAAGDARGRLDLLGVFESELKRLSNAVDAVRLPSAGGFFPPADASRRKLNTELRRLRAALRDGAVAARGLRSFLAGPSTYLVLAANNAEMRAGGMVLQAGGLRAVDGRVLAGGFRSTGELVLPDPVPLPEEIEKLYGWLDPGVEWRNVGSSPNFPAVAPVYAAMAERTSRVRLDGVLQIDVLGVRALLEVLGPVTVDGRRYDAANVGRLVMHDLYRAFGGDQVERRREFSRLAGATFQALEERGVRPGAIARALSSAAAGRHLLAWSRRPVDQAAWTSLGVDGSLERDGLMLTVQNHTGNKLDWFLRPRMQLRIEERPRAWRRVHARISIANRAPPMPPSIVAGDGSIVPVGVYRALVAVYLPGWARNVEMSGRVALVGPDGPMRVIGTRIDIPRGGSVTLEVSFSVPPDVRRIVLLPSSRAGPVPVTFGAFRSDDAVRRVLEI